MVTRCKHGLRPDWCATCRARTRDTGPVRLDPWGHRIGGSAPRLAPSRPPLKPTKQPRRQSAVRQVWAGRTPEERAAIGRKISAARKGHRQDPEVVAKRAAKCRETWKRCGEEARRTQSAPAVKAAREKLAGTERRRSINRAAWEAARQRPLEERRATARRGAATRKRTGVDRKAVAAMSAANREWWSKLSPEQRSALNRQRALKRWRRVRGESDSI